ncbi:MAG: Crp/Fnr family transcriptional regulator [Solirubrobacteraceae bacterium]
MTTGRDETIATLRSVPTFSALTEDELARVADVAVPRSFQAGEMIFREGDDGDTCYAVAAGRVRALREHPDGRAITLATLGPGELFGELALFDDEPRSATVEAIEDTQLTALVGGDMRRLLREHVEIAVTLLGTLGRRLRETNERLARQSFQSVQSRVAATLAQLAAHAPVRDGDSAGVLVTATQAELAQMAGASRESASRFLAGLEREGVIAQGRGWLTIHDPERLAGYVY